MAEAILFHLASKVAEKIGFLALKEVGLAWGLEDELKTLEGTLSTINAVLIDAGQKTQGNNLVMSLWLERLQAAFYEADNVLDEFHYEILFRQVLRNDDTSIGLKIEQHGNLLNTCRMPEIVHDLAVLMANEECSSTANYGSGSISEKVKHVPFRDSNCSREEEVTKSLFELVNLRTIFLSFQGVGANDTGFVDRCISNFKYLHVLDLSNSCFQVLPHSIGNLKHLRFLDLSGNANIDTLPNAICKLYHLETLRIWYCIKIQELPKNIGNLISLRHLYLTTQQSCLPEKEIQRLTSLQSFCITGCGNLTSLPEGMQLLVALRTVMISACPNLTYLPSTMKNLAKFENLEISNCPNLNLTEWEDFRGLRRLQ
ncbi:Disease resistance protein RGA2 [Camellia lanceoleosa]|uniref:Disease resistance protein RGA2 n=1 Tax=Camellia lanceoleosa TaxID=1840588 RepID=A0ACC0G5K0_9ERIC|nr:Disease resistance protein RGA2 [Camellia lanceoleosa]